MARRRCLTCGTITTQARCPSCARAKRQLYQGDYPQRAQAVRDTATHCHLCGQGPRHDDPWQADHLTPGDPNSPLLAAHRSCNASRRDEQR
jgi:hypothetical protein